MKLRGRELDVDRVGAAARVLRGAEDLGGGGEAAGLAVDQRLLALAGVLVPAALRGAGEAVLEGGVGLGAPRGECVGQGVAVAAVRPRVLGIPHDPRAEQVLGRVAVEPGDAGDGGDAPVGAGVVDGDRGVGGGQLALAGVHALQVIAEASQGGGVVGEAEVLRGIDGEELLELEIRAVEAGHGDGVGDGASLLRWIFGDLDVAREGEDPGESLLGGGGELLVAGIDGQVAEGERVAGTLERFGWGAVGLRALVVLDALRDRPAIVVDDARRVARVAPRGA